MRNWTGEGVPWAPSILVKAEVNYLSVLLYLNFHEDMGCPSWSPLYLQRLAQCLELSRCSDTCWPKASTQSPVKIDKQLLRGQITPEVSHNQASSEPVT